LGLAALGLAAPACFVSNEGIPPPLDALYFPTGLVVSPGGSTLYVTNSDFDLQFNGGTVFALELGAIRSQLIDLAGRLQDVGMSDTSVPLTEVCSSVPAIAQSPDIVDNPRFPRNANPLLYPGPCAPIPIEGFIGASATIGAFASGAALITRPGREGARLFVPVRGDRSVTFFDVVDDRGKPDNDVFRLDCGGDAEQHRCSDRFRIGQNPYESTRNLTLPVEPVGIAASEDGEALLLAHQTEDQVSLVVNRWSDGGSEDARPTLEFIRGNVPDSPTEVAALDVPAVVEAIRTQNKSIDYQPGFLVTFRGAAEVDLFRYYDDRGSNPPRPFVVRAGFASISANAVGTDSRGIAIDPSERHACEEACVGALDCLSACAAVPLRVFVANRSPPSLLVGRVETTLVYDPGESEPSSAFDRIFITDSIPLAIGASKVAVGRVINAQGELKVHAFAAAFDSRLVFSYDPEARRVDAAIRTGRGPHALAFDNAAPSAGANGHALLFVGHFTDSYIGVVDLDMRHPQTFGSMIASLGTPNPPRESK